MEKLKEKWILLDTNLIINSSKNLKSFENFFLELKQNDIVPCIDECINLEYLRTSNSNASLSKKSTYLNVLLGKDMTVLKINGGTLKDARRLSILNSAFNNSRDMDFADSMIAAQLKQYGDKIALATCNNKHFTTKLFNRILVKTIEAEDEIFTVGFYEFSEEKYNNLAKRFGEIKDEQKSIQKTN